MSRINFSKGIRTKYLGRNGYHNCQGLSVTHTELGGERTIFIEPINTRDEVGRARIEVPDQEDIVIELVSDLLNVAQHRVINMLRECRGQGHDHYAKERLEARDWTDADIVTIARERKIQAIKMYRFKTGAGLVESKKEVERLVAEADAEEEKAQERVLA